MSQRVTFAGKNGETLEGEIAEPQGSKRAGAVVVIQEYWGVNDHVRSLVDRFASDGFLALAPDLYHGTITKDASEAQKLMAALDKPRAVHEIGAACVFLKEHARSNGKVGVTGFCLGGGLAFAAAANVPGLAAVVPFYGLPGDHVKDWSKASAPVLAHFSKRDKWATPAGAEAIQTELASRGRQMELCLYDAEHAFMNDTRPEVYEPASAKLAWERTISFFKSRLS
jgi:carboxymethylenebutenolidase